MKLSSQSLKATTMAMTKLISSLCLLLPVVLVHVPTLVNAFFMQPSFSSRPYSSPVVVSNADIAYHNHGRNIATSKTTTSTPTSLHESTSDSSTPITSNSDATSSYSYSRIFDFTNSTYDTVNKFDRIDDVIMGGISTSTLRQQDNEPYSRWSGICREDGGGFCGIRTLPFEEPMKVGQNMDGGLYVKCRFTSDDEPERRVWKVTTRTDTSRGEQLYQAMIEIPKCNNDNWVTVHVPFEDFRLVRGARLMADTESKMNVTGGLYQIGMVMSKFTIAKNMTAIDNFRPGYFELQISEIGVYSKAATTTKDVTAIEANVDDKSKMEVQVLSKEQASKRLPILLKVLRPVSKLFFSEQSQRRKSAMRILTKERGYTRWQAIRYGLFVRAKAYGWIMSTFQTLGIISIDVLRKTIFTALRLVLVQPIVIIRKLTKRIKNVFSKKTVEAKS